MAGLKWVSGLKFRDDWYPCPDCERQADPYGLHAITCQRSGSTSRGHTAIRVAVGELFAKAGLPAVPEQRLPDSLDRPADLLLSSWRGRTVAADVTIITPTRSSSSIPATSTTTSMDQAAHQKEQKGKRLCEAAGLAFQPFVADTYGAMRQNAREFISRFIRKYSHKFAPLDEAEAGRAIWCTISTAIISRAAKQLCGLTSADSPLGMPLQHRRYQDLFVFSFLVGDPRGLVGGVVGGSSGGWESKKREKTKQNEISRKNQRKTTACSRNRFLTP